MTATSAEAFAAWCAFLAPTEGGLSLDPLDSGNFTPDGKLVGSKFGISAHSYPDIDISNLTLEQAQLLRKRDFWDKVRGDELPGPVAFVLAEAAYGSGHGRAIMQMQGVVGAAVDGVFGAETMAALTARLAQPGGVDKFVVEYEAQRLLFEAGLGAKWEHNKVGWTRRMFGGAAIALDLDNPTPPIESVRAPDALPTPPIAPPAPAMMMLGEGTFLVTVKRYAPDATPEPPTLPAEHPAADDLNAAELDRLRSGGS